MAKTTTHGSRIRKRLVFHQNSGVTPVGSKTLETKMAATLLAKTPSLSWPPNRHTGYGCSLCHGTGCDQKVIGEQSYMPRM